MTNTPLNPDALEAGAKALFMRERKYHTPTLECPEPPNWEDLTETSLEHYRDNARAVLAVAQPVVNSVEELASLPAGTLVRSGGREFYKTSYVELPWILPDGVDRFGSGYLAKHSKVTVTHRPEVNDG